MKSFRKSNPKDTKLYDNKNNGDMNHGNFPGTYCISEEYVNNYITNYGGLI